MTSKKRGLFAGSRNKNRFIPLDENQEQDENQQQHDQQDGNDFDENNDSTGPVRTQSSNLTSKVMREQFLEFFSGTSPSRSGRGGGGNRGGRGRGSGGGMRGGRGGGGQGRSGGSSSTTYGVTVQTAVRYMNISIEDLTLAKMNPMKPKTTTTTTNSNTTSSTSSRIGERDAGIMSGSQSQSNHSVGDDDVQQEENLEEDDVIQQPTRKRRRVVSPPSEIGGNDDPYYPPQLERMSKEEYEQIMGVDQGPLGCFACRNIGDKHPSIEGTVLIQLEEYLTKNIPNSNLDQHVVGASHFYTVAIRNPANACLQDDEEPLPPWNPQTIKNHLLFHNGHPEVFQYLFASKVQAITLFSLDNMVTKYKISCRVVIPSRNVGNTNPDSSGRGRNNHPDHGGDEEIPEWLRREQDQEQARDNGTHFVLPPGIDLAELMISEKFDTDGCISISQRLLQRYNTGLNIDFASLTPSEILELCEGTCSITTEKMIDHDSIKSLKDLMSIYLPFSKSDTTKMLPSYSKERPQYTSRIGVIDVERKKLSNDNVFEWNAFFTERKTEQQLLTDGSSGGNTNHENGPLVSNKTRSVASSNGGGSGGGSSHSTMQGFNTPLNVNKMIKGGGNIAS
jgi:hypothetical protein